tara:strand:+ start:296 stop:487 length:192 start_codon:yes stop_codon:yes gene_type:complete
MTIQSINAYTPSKGADPKLDRTWATKEEVRMTNAEIESLKEELNKMKIVLNKLVQKELDRESL